MGKKVLLGVTGCIAAYKSCEILRGLQKAGVDVEVVMTEHACEFVGPTTFSALSGAPAMVDNFCGGDDAIPHIRLAEGCDLFLIAPCTGNVLGKIANGIADDLLTSCALVAHDKMAVCPAMNVHMYESPSVQANLRSLRERGVEVLDPDSGYLACGDIGAGRLPEPEDIVDAVIRLLDEQGEGASKEGLSMEGMDVLVTAGPTHEWIDPVRFVSNPSTGKMGYAIAKAARDAGAEVTLVSGPVALDDPEGVKVVRIQTADDMLAACDEAFGTCDIAVFSAAVSDYKPAKAADHKLKKGTDDSDLETIQMVRNPDILATMCKRKTAGQFVIGFAAETNDVVENARRKLESKGCDMIVANEVGGGKGFGEDGDVATLVTAKGEVELPYMSKAELAETVLRAACDNFKVC